MPSGAQMILRSVSNIVLVAMLGTFGTFATAGYGLADRLMFVSLVPCFGIGNTSGTLVGQNLGAGKPERADRSARWVGAYAGVYLLGMTILLFLFAEPLVAFFDPTPQVVTIGAACIRIVSLSLVLDGVGFTLGRGLDGAGNTLPAAIINLLTLWGLQLPVAFALSQWLGFGLTGIWWGRALANVANGLLFVTWFRRGKWKELEV
jgi:Na+-driven multidrug efflux pump